MAKMKKPSQKVCNFCLKDKADSGMLIESPDSVNQALICGDCIRNCSNILDEEMRKNQPKIDKLNAIPTPRSMYEHLNRFIIGQDAPKRKLATAITSHYKRLIDNQEALSKNPIIRDANLAKVKLEKSNILLIGPTGSGKTLLAKSLAEKLNVPFAIGDATTLTEAGYVGEDVENLLLKLLHAADFNLAAAERGIIYIDEIDKLHKTGGNVSLTRDVSGEGVQQSLLKLIEGTVANIPPQGGRKHPEQQFIQMDTSNILFICGGSFSGLDEIIARRLGRGQIGFNNTNTQSTQKVINELLPKVEQDDLEKFGIIPELVGRLPVVATLEELGVEDLVRVLVEPENALLRQYQKLCAYDASILEFTPTAVREIAMKAKEKGTGARALRSVCENVLGEIMFNLPDYRNSRIVIDETIVRGEQEATFLKILNEAA
jgi:ATP-dependent Clp protease ATP-binding subunit ClpX